jgi:hypothetical protein
VDVVQESGRYRVVLALARPRELKRRGARPFGPAIAGEIGDRE